MRLPLTGGFMIIAVACMRGRSATDLLFAVYMQHEPIYHQHEGKSAGCLASPHA